MTQQFTLDDNDRKSFFKKILKSHIWLYALMFSAFFVAGVVCIGIGFGFHVRDVWSEGFILFVTAIPYGIVCLVFYLKDKAFILGNLHGAIHFDLTVDESSIQLKNIDTDEEISCNTDQIKSYYVSNDAVILFFNKKKAVLLPRTPEIDNLPLVRQAIAKNQSKQIRTIAILFAVFIVVAMCIWGTTTVVHKKNQISYYSDATYQEVQCRVINVYEESGLLCIEAEIMTGGDSLQPIDGRYRFAFVSESAKMAHLTIDDVIIIKSTIFKGNQINAYLVAYLEKNEFSYVDFNTGKQDVLYWQATHF